MEKYPGARIRQVVLARIRGEGLAWVVNFEPDSVVPDPPMGSTDLSTDPEDIETIFALSFVNANTGEWTGGLQSSRSKQLD